MLSPYINRDAIREPGDFFGRTNELSQLYALILQGQFAILTGERRVGKSSILNALRFKREEFGVPEDLAFVYLNSQYFGDAEEEDFLESLLEQIAKETGASQFPPTRESLKKVSQELAGQPRSRRLVMVLDEIDVLAHNRRIPQKLFSVLRAWAQGFQVPFVVATREGYFERLVETQGAGSPFWNIFRPIYVGPFQENEALELVSTPAQDLGMPFTNQEIREILKLGGRQPFFLEMACDHLFQIKMARRGQEPDWERLELEFREEAMPHLDYLWEHLLPDVEGKAIIALVLDATFPDAEVRRGLTRKGVLVEDQEGTRVFSAALSDDIRRWDQLVQKLADPERNALFSFALSGSFPDRKTSAELLRRGILKTDQGDLRLPSPVLLDVIRFRLAVLPSTLSFLRRAAEHLME